MHLVSCEDQLVPIGGVSFFFAEGEPIRTEHSYKYNLRDLRSLASSSGFSVNQVWTDDRNYFSVQYWTVRDGG